MSYTALYRKWRPMVFKEVVGQESITATIRNQIRTGTIGHAYLFSGTRGTGKTSTAKLFSRAINCLQPEEENPCNRCEICQGILDESLMDVIEIDAASNNGVDDIRELRENVKYPPAKAKYKVYIIDEVHMLSTGAFNALLKTLEEPPGYVVFILATTEPHKLPATILSRCQRFDFKRVGAYDMAHRLRYITEAQGFTIDDEALQIMTRKSDGAVRDALSMLDQCLSYGEMHIDAEVAGAALGLVNREWISNLVEALILKDIMAVFGAMEELIGQGKNLSQFVKDFIEYYRDLMMISAAGPDEKLIKTGMSLEILSNQAKCLGMSGVWQGLQSLIELDNAMKWSANSRVLMEMALVKMTSPSVQEVSGDNLGESKALEALIKRVESLEKALKGVAAGSFGVGGTSTQRMGTSVQAMASKTVSVSSREPNAEPGGASAQADREDAGGPVDGRMIHDKWSEILQLLKKRKVSLYAFLVEGTLISVTGKVVNVGFKDGFGFHLNAISQEANRQEVEKAVYSVTGFQVRMHFDYLEAFAGEQVQEDSSDLTEHLKTFLGEESDKLEVIE